MFLIAYIIIGVLLVTSSVIITALNNKILNKFRSSIRMYEIKYHSRQEQKLIKKQGIEFPVHHKITERLVIAQKGKVPILIYKIEKGEANVYYSGKKIGELKADDIFGVHEVINNEPSKFEIRVYKGTEIETVGKSVFSKTESGDNYETKRQ
jgi:CRP-like cAMP-binding protein